MLRYREIAPAPPFSDRLECFWTIPAGHAVPSHRVSPDGCADLLLTTLGGRATLYAVGPMTRYRDHAVAAGQEMFGVRFRPGRWPGEHVPDAILPLDDLWGKSARRLLDRLAHTPSPIDRARLVECVLPPDSPGPVERALAALERSAGALSLDDLARAANLSPRQFRRLCEARTGYTPKFLARILRFRRAAARLTAGESAAAVAADCGYYDQAHLINDYRAFAGRPPGAVAAHRDIAPGVVGIGFRD